MGQAFASGKIVDAMASPADAVALVNMNVVGGEGKNGKDKGGGLVLRRHGLWRWKFSGIELSKALAARQSPERHQRTGLHAQ